jgi:hypothetical protein
MTNLPEEQLTDGPLDALVERYRAELKRLRRRVPLVHGRELPVPPHGARPSAKLSQLRPFSLTLLVQSTQSILSCLPQAGRYLGLEPRAVLRGHRDHRRPRQHEAGRLHFTEPANVLCVVSLVASIGPPKAREGLPGAPAANLLGAPTCRHACGFCRSRSK